jgi:hypothetical protein
MTARCRSSRRLGVPAVVAQAFEKFMAKVNARIYEGLRKGAASPIITLS